MTTRSENVTAILQQIAQGRLSPEQGSLLFNALVTDAGTAIRDKRDRLRMRGHA